MRAKTLSGLGLIYLLWCSAALAIWGAGLGLSLEGGIGIALSELSALLALTLVLRLYLTWVEPGLGRRGWLRPGLIAVLAVFFGSGYAAAASGPLHPVTASFFTATLLLLSSVLGGWITAPLKRPAEIIPLCLVASLADIVSVAAGPTRQFAETILTYYTDGMQGPPPLVDFFLIKIALPGQAVPLPLFGASDWVILVFLSSAAAKFQMDDGLFSRFRPASPPQKGLDVPVAFAGLVTALVLARILDTFVPALPFEAAAFSGLMAVRYPRMRQMTRAELLPMIAVAAAVVGIMVWLSRG